MKPILRGSLCAGALLTAAALAGATTLEEIETVQADRAEAGRQSQNRIDDIVKETDSLETEYKRVLKELEGLKVFNTLMQRQIDRQESDIGKLNQAIDEVEATGPPDAAADGAHDRVAGFVRGGGCAIPAGRAPQPGCEPL